MTPKELAKRVIAELNEIARDYDDYEYGLPVFSAEESARMEAAVVKALQAFRVCDDAPAIPTHEIGGEG